MDIEIFKQLAEKMPLAFIINEIVYDGAGVPADLKIVFANSEFESKFGLFNKQVIGENITERLFKSARERNLWLKPILSLAISQGSLEFDRTFEYNANWFAVSAFMLKNECIGILFHEAERFANAAAKICQNVSSLKDSLDFSKRIFNNAPFAIVVYEVLNSGESSMDYIIKRINSAGLKIENMREEDCLGKPLGQVRPGVDEFGIISVLKKVWETGETINYPAKIYKEGTQKRWYENTVYKLNPGEIVAVYADVTERKEADEKLVAEKERLKVTLYSIGDGVITTDKNGRIEIINPVAEQLTGWKQHEAAGKDLSEVFDIYNERTGQACKNPVELVLKKGSMVGIANQTVLKAKDGTIKLIADSASPIKTPKNDISGVILVIRDVTEEKQKEAKIKFLSYKDYLTGLYNRAFVEEEFKKLDSGKKYPLTLVMGDLDGLKFFNEAFGHQAGDDALKKLARIFEKYCPDHALISRWGGDEFLVILPETSLEAGNKISDRIKEACRKTKVAGTYLSASLGCACKNDNHERWEQVLKRAEDKMYKSKLLGAKSYRSVILNSIKNTLFEKSFETEEHGERVGLYCRKIGNSMGLSSSEIGELEVLAMLHDIGKIAIDVRILNKKTPLTKNEWKTLKRHPEIGYRIANSVPELVNIAEYILAHHERWDGKGYPQALAGDKIPLLSRILAVADAYDAMCEGRPYKKAVPVQKAKEELIKNAGTQFDPNVVITFLNCLEIAEK